jgi:hypothetical protein
MALQIRKENRPVLRRGSGLTGEEKMGARRRADIPSATLSPIECGLAARWSARS